MQHIPGNYDFIVTMSSLSDNSTNRKLKRVYGWQYSKFVSLSLLSNIKLPIKRCNVMEQNASVGSVYHPGRECNIYIA